MGLNNPHVTKNRNKKIEEIKKSFHDGHIGALQFQVFSVFQMTTHPEHFVINSNYSIIKIHKY